MVVVIIIVVVVVMNIDTVYMVIDMKNRMSGYGGSGCAVRLLKIQVQNKG